ncbi:MAG: tetratricopeptide repeat protein [Pseudomonadales bacterium]
MEFKEAFRDLEAANQALNRGNRRDALSIFHDLATKGYEPAMFMLGEMLASPSNGGVEQNFEAAKMWYEIHYQQTSDALSALGLAKLYFKGKGVKQDIGKALDILVPHANDSDARINMLLGRIYGSNLGCAGSLEKSISQLETAYSKGNVYSLKYKGWLLIESGSRFTGVLVLVRGFVLVLWASIKRNHTAVVPY